MRSGTGFFTLTLLILLSSCNRASLWGEPRAEVMASLARRDYSFLEVVDYGRYGDSRELGPGAPYYLGKHLALAGRDADARRMFAVGAADTGEPWKSLCLDELTKTGTPAERLESVRALVKRKDEELAARAKRAKSAKKGAEDKAREYAAESREIDILKDLEMELALETGDFDRKSADVTAWFYSRSMTRSLSDLVPSLPEGLERDFYGIAATRAQVYKRDYGSAWVGAKAILEARPNAAFNRPVLSDFCKAALYGSSDPAAAAVFLDAIRGAPSALPEGAPFVLAFYSGRLYAASAERLGAVATRPSAGSRVAKGGAKVASTKDERKRLTALSRERFEAALSLAPTDADRDTVLWYILKGASGPEAFLSEMEYCADRWTTPSFFSDVIDSFVVERVAARDLGSIARLHGKLAGKGAGESLARIAYLAARSGKLDEDARLGAYRDAFEGDHGSLYYRVMAAEALGLSIADSSTLYRARRVALEKTVDADEAERVLSGFIDFYLPERVWPEAQSRYPGLPIKVARVLAGRLEEAGEWSGAIRLMAFSLVNSGDSVTDGDLALVYPRPWLPEVEAAARENGIPEYLLYAMIRSESLFSPRVRSASGAIGLSQLMKPTASDIARRLGFATYDLDDPATNIAFGSFYLSEMIRRMNGKVLPALFAYNAGINRVRAWQKDASGLDDDLFLESLPYGETREYGRKVLAAAAVYGYLYYQKSPGDVVRELF